MIQEHLIPSIRNLDRPKELLKGKPRKAAQYAIN